MKIFLYAVTLITLINKTFASGYTIQGHALEEVLDGQSSGRFTVKSGNTDDLAVVTFKDKELKILWGNQLPNPNEIVSQPVLSGTMSQISGVGQFSIGSGVLGNSTTNSEYEQSFLSFGGVSFAFKDQATFRAPESQPSVVREFILTKRAGIHAPYIIGVIDFRKQDDNFLPKSDNFPGFLIKGADLTFVVKTP